MFDAACAILSAPSPISVPHIANGLRADTYLLPSSSIAIAFRSSWICCCPATVSLSSTSFSSFESALWTPEDTSQLPCLSNAKGAAQTESRARIQG
eukprot:3791867-Rhodomonas_salina.1